jgi:hypothetical protein
MLPLLITEDVRSENPVEESLWVEAAEKADSLGVDIINTSLGYFEFDNTYNHTYSDMDGITALYPEELKFCRGMIVVVCSEGSTFPHISASRCSFSISYWRS